MSQRHMIGWVVAALCTLATQAAAQGVFARPLQESPSRIGVSIREVRDGDLAAAKLARPDGAYIETVQSNTPAERAGLRVGDIVLEFDSEHVRGARHFTRLVQETPAGRTVQIAVNRAGARQTMSITPEEGPQSRLDLGDIRDRFEGTLDDLLSESPPRVSVRRLGLSLTPLSSQLATYFGVSNGVLVSDVASDSPAARANVRAGDVITAIDGRRVDSAADVTARVRQSDRDTVELTLMRDKREVRAQVRPGETARRSSRTRGV